MLLAARMSDSLACTISVQRMCVVRVSQRAHSDVRHVWIKRAPAAVARRT